MKTWCADIEKLDAKFGYKFFDSLKTRDDNPNTDYAKEKDLPPKILKRHTNYGFKPNRCNPCFVFMVFQRR